MTKRKNESETDIDVFNYLSNQKNFSQKWHSKKQNNKIIQKVLDTASKKGTGNCGTPDLIYVNEGQRLLILVENKAHIADHESPDRDNPVNFAVDGIIHYLGFFKEVNLSKLSQSIQNTLKDWYVIGIAFSGDISDQYNHMISTFLIRNGEIEEKNINEFLDEADYTALFENLDLEEISNNVSKSSRTINRILRNTDSQKRPVLLSALMICLYEKDGQPNDFKHSYHNWQTSTIVRNITSTIEGILLSEGIPQSKIDVLVNELAFIKTDHDINNTDILKNILIELEDNVIPLFNKKSSYDIIGKFYEEFLRFAGIANVKKGIVLTPNHVTNIFTKLIDIKHNDVIFDPCCGSGAFLIAGMNKLINIINNSSLADKSKRISDVKKKQLLGFDKSNTMYALAIPNMLFRGDGKSQIHNIDFFSDEANDFLDEMKPTIGFVNPPYGGSDNKENPTKKEIQFLEKMLDNVSRYGIMIAPISTYIKNNSIRNRILTKHTLKCVINMPIDLFQPNASAVTSIAVFETNLPHNDKSVTFYNLNDDGYVLSKHRGRMDLYNKWRAIEIDLLAKLADPSSYMDNMQLVHCPIKVDDEWVLQAHSKTDYSTLTEQDFLSIMKRQIIFSLKRKLKIDDSVDEITLLELLHQNIDSSPILNCSNKLDAKSWREFQYGDDIGIFDISGGYYNKKPVHTISGDIPFIGASKERNGITEYYSEEDIESSHKDSNSTSHSIDKKIFSKNCITVANNGSVGSAFFQQEDFTCSHDVNVLYLKDYELNIYVAMFLCTLIEKEKFRWGFGRKWRPIRMPSSIIKLPSKEATDENGQPIYATDENDEFVIDKDGNALVKVVPDWQFMEDYIKSLPYSASL